MKLLLVEDNEENFDMLSRRLARRGYDVVRAVDGQDALEKAHSERPDIMLLDMSLPVIEGWEVARSLRSDTEMASLPIIALTAHAMAEDRERALESGCNEYETKPIDLPRLLEKIEALTQERKQIDPV